MKEIFLTRGCTALVDDELFDELSKFRWATHKTGYAVRKSAHPTKSGEYIVLWMHREILGLSFGDGVMVDHIDGNRLNNVRANLRICTQAQNQWNRSAPGHNTSGFKGVSWKKDHGKWNARIQHNMKTVNLGYFGTAEDAYAAYCKAAAELHGRFASRDL
ncbi:AP2 domain-containing protein [Burkholderia cenocepacia]